MGQIKQVVLCGYGGQGIVLAGTMLGKAAFNDGKWVSSTNSFGSAARGGACRAEVVISDGPVIFPHVIEARQDNLRRGRIRQNRFTTNYALGDGATDKLFRPAPLP